MSFVFDQASAYAEHMDGWRAEPHPSERDYALLVNDSERVRLSVHQSWRSTRLVIHPELPYRSGVSGPGVREITVDPSRDTLAVAKDILRRAVPAAIDGTRQWEANIAAADDRQARVDRLRADMAAEFPALTPWPGEDPRFDWRPPQDDEDYRTRGTVKLHTGYRVGPSGKLEENGYEGDIELRGLPLDAVKRVLRALAEEG